MSEPASAGPAAACPDCGAALASADQAITVDGAHAHDVVNSAGLRFRLRCYGDAPGAIGAGTATDEDSWFPGHTWQRAYCRRCSAHRGWLFRGKAQVFYALT